MKSQQSRVCIYIKDIQNITGKSYRSSKKLNAIIKKSINKEKHQFISLEEFCSYTGLNKEEVIPFITG